MYIQFLIVYSQQCRLLTDCSELWDDQLQCFFFSESLQSLSLSTDPSKWGSKFSCIWCFIWCVLKTCSECSICFSRSGGVQWHTPLGSVGEPSFSCLSHLQSFLRTYTWQSARNHFSQSSPEAMHHTARLWGIASSLFIPLNIPKRCLSQRN